jgi:hypothetical protein
MIYRGLPIKHGDSPIRKLSNPQRDSKGTKWILKEIAGWKTYKNYFLSGMHPQVGIHFLGIGVNTKFHAWSSKPYNYDDIMPNTKQWFPESYIDSWWCWCQPGAAALAHMVQALKDI